MLLCYWMEFLREILIAWRITDSSVFLIPLCGGEWINRGSNLFSDFYHGRPVVGKKNADLARWALSRCPGLGVTVAQLRLFNPRNLETGTLKLCRGAEKIPVTCCPVYGMAVSSLCVSWVSVPRCILMCTVPRLRVWLVTRCSIGSGGPLASIPILFPNWCMWTLQTLGLCCEGLLVLTLFLTSKRK